MKQLKLEKEVKVPVKLPWRPPTRRMFVAMLGAAAASFAIREEVQRGSGAEPPKWIGHC